MAKIRLKYKPFKVNMKMDNFFPYTANCLKPAIMHDENPAIAPSFEKSASLG